MKPFLILVNGLPCSGKTTLAREISQKYQLPLYEKDRIKEILFETLGWKDVAWSRKLSQASKHILFEIISQEISSSHSLLVECNFISEFDSLPIRNALLGKNCQVIQIICHAPGDVLIERFRKRSGSRHPGHNDDILLSEIQLTLQLGKVPSLEIDGTHIEVDTTDPISIDQFWEYLTIILS